MTEKLTATVRLTLRSAATFGRGDGIAGFIHREVEHDSDGMPFLRGRTLKGLLREAAEEAVFALGDQVGNADWVRLKNELFGQPGSSLSGQGKLRVSDACLPDSLRRLVNNEVQQGKLKREDVLHSLTGIRKQTAMNPYGAPDHATLRSMRVILRDVRFESQLSFTQSLTDDEWTLIAVATLALRAAGTGRNRGRGWLQAVLDDEATTHRHFARLLTSPDPQTPAEE